MLKSLIPKKENIGYNEIVSPDSKYISKFYGISTLINFK